MTAKKAPAKPEPAALAQLPRYADLVVELGEPNLTKAKTYEECAALAMREKKAG